MSFSYYEVYTTSLRAFSSMGFPYGADEDAAYIIAWLELNKFNGLNSLVDSIGVLDNKYDGKIKLNSHNDTSIDLNYASLLMKGPGLIDFYQSELDDKKDLHITRTNKMTSGLLKRHPLTNYSHFPLVILPVHSTQNN